MDAPSRDVRKKVLVLFPNEWDRVELAATKYRDRYEFSFEGFDLFRFPQNLQLLWFDARRFIDRIVARYQDAGLDGVVSNEEQFGTLITALVARRLGLPGTDPDAVRLCQHKYYARLLQQRVEPEATPAFTVFPMDLSHPAQIDLPYPFFVKPVKATFSILARRIHGPDELRALLDFRPLERRILRKLIQPCNDLAEFEIDAGHMLAEEILTGQQYTVEGMVHDGVTTILGVVDSVMYVGTDAFERFEYPSSLSSDVQARMAVLAERVLSAAGFDHGVFNVEMFHDPASGRIQILEINPRLAYQFADLRRKVDGYECYEAVLALAVGQTPPQFTPRLGEHAASASFVFRTFEPRRLKTYPNARRLQRLRRSYDDARLMIYRKSSAQMHREMRWLGSCRHAICNLGAEDQAQLYDRYRRVRHELALKLA